MSYDIIEKIVFWGCTLLVVQNFRVFLKLVQAQPAIITEHISILIPRSGRMLKDILNNDHNEQKFKLSLWYLKARDIIGITSLFSGLFMLGAYVTYLRQLFNIDRSQVFVLVAINAVILFIYTLQKIKCQNVCVAFGQRDLADGIKAGHY